MRVLKEEELQALPPLGFDLDTVSVLGVKPLELDWPQSLRDKIHTNGRGNQTVVLPIDRVQTTKICYNELLGCSNTLVLTGLQNFTESHVRAPADLLDYITTYLLWPSKGITPPLHTDLAIPHPHPNYIEWSVGGKQSVWLRADVVVGTLIVLLATLDGVDRFTTKYNEREIRTFLQRHLTVVCVLLRHFLNHNRQHHESVLLSKKPQHLTGYVKPVVFVNA
jgi:hypothetical protein